MSAASPADVRLGAKCSNYNCSVSQLAPHSVSSISHKGLAVLHKTVDLQKASISMGITL